MSKNISPAFLGVLSLLPLISFAGESIQKKTPLTLFDFVAYTSEHLQAECTDYGGRVGSGWSAELKDFQVLGPSRDECALFVEKSVSSVRGSIEATSLGTSSFTCVESRHFYPLNTAYSERSPKNPVVFSFTELNREMLALSDWLSFRAQERYPLGQMSVQGVLESVTSSSNVTIFKIDSKTLSNLKNITFKGTKDSIFIVNVFGSDASLVGVGIKEMGGVKSNHILIHFASATSVRIQKTGAARGVFGPHIGIPATVLAPYARVIFNDALITGALYAKEIIGKATPVLACLGARGGQINPGCFDGGADLAMGCGYPPLGNEPPKSAPMTKSEKGKEQ